MWSGTRARTSPTPAFGGHAGIERRAGKIVEVREYSTESEALEALGQAASK